MLCGDRDPDNVPYNRRRHPARNSDLRCMLRLGRRGRAPGLPSPRGPGCATEELTTLQAKMRLAPVLLLALFLGCARGQLWCSQLRGPGAPVGLIATGGNGNVTVAWDRPAGTACVASYKVREWPCANPQMASCIESALCSSRSVFCSADRHPEE